MARKLTEPWRLHRVASLFGEVTVRLPRFLCPRCGRTEAGASWPSHCRSTPELDQLQAHLSALMTYRVAAGVLQHLLPVKARQKPRDIAQPYAADRRAAWRCRRGQAGGRG